MKNKTYCSCPVSFTTPQIMDLNDTIDDEDTLCMPSLDNIQPYQFEPMSEMGSNATEMSESFRRSSEIYQNVCEMYIPTVIL
jgi:hypothetical protein